MPLQPNGLGPGEQVYTPVLTATTTSPTLGTGGTAVGGWQSITGSLIWWWAAFTLGESPDPGEGYYQVSLPRDPVSDPGRGVGDGVIQDISASAELRPVRAVCSTQLAVAMGGYSTRPFIMDISAPAAFMAALVSHEAPFTWAEGDVVNLTGTYQALG